MMVLKNSLKQFVKAGLRMGLNFMKGYPKCRLYVTAIVRKLGLEAVARSVQARLKPDKYRPAMNFIPKDASQLSPRARQIYVELKAAIEYRQKERR